MAADALLIATSENFGGMAGIVKDFLERTYYPCEGKLEGRPYAVLVCAGTDGTRRRDVDRVATGLRLSKVHPGLIYKSGVTAQTVIVPDDILAQCREIGATSRGRHRRRHLLGIVTGQQRLAGAPTGRSSTLR